MENAMDTGSCSQFTVAGLCLCNSLPAELRHPNISLSEGVPLCLEVSGFVLWQIENLKNTLQSLPNELRAKAVDFINKSVSPPAASNAVYVLLLWYVIYDFSMCVCVRRSIVGGMQVLAGKLSLSCTRLLAGRVTILWLCHPLSVSQHGQLSLPSLQGRLMSSNPCCSGLRRETAEGVVRGVAYRPRQRVLLAARLECRLAAGSRPRNGDERRCLALWAVREPTSHWGLSLVLSCFCYECIGTHQLQLNGSMEIIDVASCNLKVL